MRLLLIAAFAVVTFGATVAVEMNEANAAVCARGWRGAGCVGPRGAVGVRRPVAVRPVVRRPVAVRSVVRPGVACRTVIRNGVAVRRCV